MNKSIFILLLLMLVAGCSDIQEEWGIKNNDLICLNGHLYYNFGYGKAPLFDYRSDTPILIQCKKAYGFIEFEKDKVK